MLTGPIRSQINQIWNAFWSGGVSNPLSVIEPLTFLIFIKQLDDIQTAEEAKVEMLGGTLDRRVFPEGMDSKGEAYANLRWSRFKNFDAVFQGLMPSLDLALSGPADICVLLIT